MAESVAAGRRHISQYWANPDFRRAYVRLVDRLGADSDQLERAEARLMQRWDETRGPPATGPATDLATGPAPATRTRSAPRLPWNSTGSDCFLMSLLVAMAFTGGPAAWSRRDAAPVGLADERTCLPELMPLALGALADHPLVGALVFPGCVADCPGGLAPFAELATRGPSRRLLDRLGRLLATLNQELETVDIRSRGLLPLGICAALRRLAERELGDQGAADRLAAQFPRVRLPPVGELGPETAAGLLLACEQMEQTCQERRGAPLLAAPADSLLVDRGEPRGELPAILADLRAGEPAGCVNWRARLFRPEATAHLRRGQQDPHEALLAILAQERVQGLAVEVTELLTAPASFAQATADELERLAADNVWSLPGFPSLSLRRDPVVAAKLGRPWPASVYPRQSVDKNASTGALVRTTTVVEGRPAVLVLHVDHGWHHANPAADERPFPLAYGPAGASVDLLPGQPMRVTAIVCWGGTLSADPSRPTSHGHYVAWIWTRNAWHLYESAGGKLQAVAGTPEQQTSWRPSQTATLILLADDTPPSMK